MERAIAGTLTAVRRFLDNTAPLLNIGFEGNLESFFAFRPLKAGSLDWLLSRLELYSPQARAACTVSLPRDADQVIFLHPGEPVFDRFRRTFCDQFADDARRGAIFIDPTVAQPSFFRLAQVNVIRQADPTIPALKRAGVLEARLIALRQWQDGKIEQCSPEYLLLLRGADDLPPAMVSFAARADGAVTAALTLLHEQASKQRAPMKRNWAQPSRMFLPRNVRLPPVWASGPVLTSGHFAHRANVSPSRSRDALLLAQ